MDSVCLRAQKSVFESVGSSFDFVWDDFLASLRGKVETAEPSRGESKVASVAVILKGRPTPETLLIKRAERAGDPWSGQIAFPGGKYQVEDGSLRATAVRETREEVGIDLETSSEFLGYYRSFRTHTGTMDVIPALFMTKKGARIRTNAEVESCRWVSLEEISSPKSRFTYRVRLGGVEKEVPAIRVGGYVVWGLTHRIISSLILEVV